MTSFIVFLNLITIGLCAYIIYQISIMKELITEKSAPIIQAAKKTRKPRVIAHTDEQLYKREKDEDFV